MQQRQRLGWVYISKPELSILQMISVTPLPASTPGALCSEEGWLERS